MKQNSGKKQGLSRKSVQRVLTWLPFVLVLVIVGIPGCSKRYHNLPAFSAFPVKDAANQSVGRFKTSYLADQIHAYFRGNINGPIAVTTFVDLDDLYRSSTFGRILAEQVLSELAMRGYQVVEVRQSDAMQIMFNSGEFGLSRETAALRDSRQISALVVGTYTASPVRVYINARIIDPATSHVISAGSVEMDKTHEITRLLRSSSFPTSLERIPVRHLGYSVSPAPHYFPNHGYAAPGNLPTFEYGEGDIDWSDPGVSKKENAGVNPELPTESPEQPVFEAGS